MTDFALSASVLDAFQFNLDPFVVRAHSITNSRVVNLRAIGADVDFHRDTGCLVFQSISFSYRVSQNGQ